MLPLNRSGSHGGDSPSTGQGGDAGDPHGVRRADAMMSPLRRTAATPDFAVSAGAKTLQQSGRQPAAAYRCRRWASRYPPCPWPLEHARSTPLTKCSGTSTRCCVRTGE